jgi:hypothetical protein
MTIERSALIPSVFLMILAAAATGAAQSQGSSSARAFSYSDLVSRLVDLEAVSVLPEAGVGMAQWSSYHRDSRYDAASGRYVAWDRNGDSSGVIRQEGDQLVLAEMTGPGCIWRIWSASPRDGRVRIFLDGADAPAVDLPFLDYFSRSAAPFSYPELVYKAAAGSNNFVPIPYQKSCRIVADKTFGAFYHFTYGTFPAGTKVPTFRRNLLPEDMTALERVDRFLAGGLGTDPAGRRRGARILSRQVEVPPAESVEVAEIHGPRAVTALKIRLRREYSLEESAVVLRSVTLRMRWDDRKEPAVWAPLGDFFGTAPGLNHFRTLPAGMTPDGFYSYWYMPFERRARIELANDGKESVPLTVTIEHAPLALPAGRYGRFHAKWHRDAFPPSEPERAVDWTLLTTRGIGRFCGVMLHVWNPKGTYKGDWWGEGDEKFFVDGEKFPSTFGTGTEDYFGYAWSFAELFQRGFHAQTFNRFDNTGHVSVNRFQIADGIPFRKSFDGYLEKYFPNELPAIYAATSYWYLDPRGEDPYGASPLDARTGYWDYILPSVGRNEAKFPMTVLHAAAKTGGQVAWADGVRGPAGRARRYFQWHSAPSGSRLAIELPLLKEAGKYAPKITLLRGPGFGRVQLYLDGDKLGGPMDLTQEILALTEVLPFPPRVLAAGAHRLEIEMLAAPPGGGAFGVDTVHLEWVP